MNHFVAGILRIVLLEASAALLVLERAVDRAATRMRARRRWAAVVVAALAVYAFANFGALRGGDAPLVHPWEQYHFFLGSKYLGELGYFDLYKATFLADREGAGVLRRTRTTRDLRTFELVDLGAALADAERVRARFSDARWAEFKADWARLSAWPGRWNDIVSDHGNSGSPAWAVVALPFVELCGSSRGGQAALGLLDVALMLALFVFLWRTFGVEIGAVGLTIWALTPFCFDYLAGSILRWDWLFAAGMALGFWRRGRPLVAGAFLGYAVVSKLFPVFFGVALAVPLVVGSLRARRLDRRLVRLAAGALASAALFVAASSAVYGPSVWSGYRERIQTAQDEKFYANQYSLKTVYLQLAESTPAEAWQGLFQPPVIKQALDRVPIDAHAGGLLVVRILVTLVVVAALARGAGAVEAFGAGPFLVYVWLTVNAYYWNMLSLTAVALAERQGRGGRLSYGLLALHAMFAAYYLYQHLNRGYAEGYIVGLLMLGVIGVWAGQAVVRPVPE